MNRHWTRYCLAVAACVLAGKAPASQLVYLAEQDVAFVPEVYLVDLDRPTESLKLNRALQSRSSGVLGITLNAEGTRMAFIADQDARGDLNLYLLDLTALGQWTRLGSLGAGALETYARFSPDGSKVAFTAVDQNFANSQLLYGGPGGGLRGRSLSGGPRRATYTPQATGSLFKTELMLLEMTAPGNAVKLNGNMPDRALEFGSYGRTAFGPDGMEVVFLTYHRDTSAHTLFFARPSEPGISIAIGQPLPRDGQFSPVPGFFQFLPADAPKVVPPSGSQPAGGGGGGGGGSFGLASLLWLIVAAACGRRGPRPWRRRRR